MKNKVGLGTFPLAGVFTKVSQEQAEGVITKFINNGGYYIDTAPLYGFGEIEKLLGKVLKQFPREKYYMITKCGYVDVEGKTFQTVEKSGKYEDVIRECDLSLKKLGVEYIDLYFVHSPDPNTPFEETIKALTKLQEQGKIKNIGVSNVNLKELQEYNQTGKIKFIQNRFSLINRSINQEFANYLLENEIGLIPYQVIERGQLTGKVFENIGNLGSEDLRNNKPDWKKEVLDEIVSWVKDKLSPIAKKKGITIGQLSIAWTFHREYLAFAIVGMTNPKFVQLNLESSKIELDDDTLLEIENAYLDLVSRIREKHGKSVREFRELNEKYY